MTNPRIQAQINAIEAQQEKYNKLNGIDFKQSLDLSTLESDSNDSQYLSLETLLSQENKDSKEKENGVNFFTELNQCKRERDAIRQSLTKMESLLSQHRENQLCRQELLETLNYVFMQYDKQNTDVEPEKLKSSVLYYFGEYIDINENVTLKATETPDEYQQFSEIKKTVKLTISFKRNLEEKQIELSVLAEKIEGLKLHNNFKSIIDEKIAVCRNVPSCKSLKDLCDQKTQLAGPFERLVKEISDLEKNQGTLSRKIQSLQDKFEEMKKKCKEEYEKLDKELKNRNASASTLLKSTTQAIELQVKTGGNALDTQIKHSKQITNVLRIQKEDEKLTQILKNLEKHVSFNLHFWETKKTTVLFGLFGGNKIKLKNDRTKKVPKGIKKIINLLQSEVTTNDDKSNQPITALNQKRIKLQNIIDYAKTRTGVGKYNCFFRKPPSRYQETEFLYQTLANLDINNLKGNEIEKLFTENPLFTTRPK